MAAKTPDIPVNLVEVPGLTTAYQIGVKWDDGAYDGSSPVIDYQIWYKESTQTDYVIFASGVLENTETIINLTPGLFYDFKVKSRNIINFSEFSLPV